MEESDEKNHKIVKEKVSALPSLTQLIQESWELFQKTAIGYLKLFALSIGAIFFGGLIGVSLAVVFSFNALTAYFHSAHHSIPFPATTATILIVWFIVYLLCILIIGISFSIVNIIILKKKKTSPIFDLIKQSRPYIVPYFLTAVLCVLLAFGGMMVFFVPGLVIGVFFIFALYEVVLEHQSGRAAIAKSYIMVKDHFWEVVLRLFILEIANLIISSFFAHVVRTDFVLRFIQFLFMVFSVWYIKAYLYVLYTHVRARTTFPAHISLRWIWIVSGIGWVLAVLFACAIGYGITHYHGSMHTIRPVHRVRPGNVLKIRR